MTAALVPARRAPRAQQNNALRQSAMAILTRAVERAVESASDETLEAIVGAGDPAQALALAPRDLAPAPPERLAAERAAKARTAHFRSELADKAGGMFTRANVADLLGITPAAIDKQRQRRQILAVPYGHEVRYPAAQFRNGAPLPGLKDVLAAFGDMNPWGQLQLLLAPLEGYSEQPASIVELLGSGVDEGVRSQLVRLVRGWAA
jgi:hypothetical protein